jgi:A/G-specific adenine glycosylase
MRTSRKEISVMAKAPTSNVKAGSFASIVHRLLHWFDKNARDLPWRRIRDPYAIWVSEIMLQQTQVKTVMPYWERWMRELPSIETLAKAKPDRILKLWEGLGYYHRGRNMQKAAQHIIASHDGEFPESFEDVLALPGVGRYTAGAICSMAFNQPTPILDGNVIRLLTRLFGVREDPREKSTNQKLWRLAEQLVLAAAAIDQPSASRKIANRQSPIANRAGSCSLFNQSLMELGALVCTPRRPKCERCPLRSICVAHQQNSVEVLPNFGRRPCQTRRRFIAFVAEHRGRFLVCQRPQKVVNARLWEFPNVEVTGGNVGHLEVARSVLKMRPASLTPFCTIKHSITRFRITLEVFRTKLKHRRAATGKGGVWLTLNQMEPLAFASAHRKILGKLLANNCDCRGSAALP